MLNTADPRLIHEFYEKLLPTLDNTVARESYYSHLSRWASMYDGSILVATYPNLKEFAQKRLSAEMLAQPPARNMEFERNLKNRSDKV